MQKEELQPLLENVSSKAKYADFKILQREGVEIALRSESFELNEEHSKQISCRALDKGYGVATTNSEDKEKIEAVADSALRQASSIQSRARLAPTKVEQGEFTHPLKKPIDKNEARNFLLYLKDILRNKLGKLYSSSELVLSHSFVESCLITSEGTNVTERTYLTDVILYLVVRDANLGYASKIVGGRGGLEVVEERDWEKIIDEIVEGARDSARAQVLSPLVKGKSFKVIFDAEAAGAVAHEVGHLLEADNFQGRLFQNIDVSEDLEIVDNPQVPGAYGSFVWDDEGVRGVKKVLLKRGQIDLLHTRFTVSRDGTPGNAHGITHIPKPSMSNVYIQPSNWGTKEMFEETSSGIYVKGVVRAETDLSDGRFELMPEIAYLIENREVKTPIKHLKIVDNIRNMIQRIDAIGKLAHLRPNVEKGFAISEGGPQIRINGVHCL
jgi:TldD protein